MVTTLDQLANDIFMAITSLLKADSVTCLYLTGHSSLRRRLKHSVTTLHFEEDWFRRLQISNSFQTLFPGLLELVVTPKPTPIAPGIFFSFFFAPIRTDTSMKLVLNNSFFETLPSSLTSLNVRSRTSFLQFTSAGHLSQICTASDLKSKFPSLKKLALSLSVEGELLTNDHPNLQIPKRIESLSELDLESLELFGFEIPAPLLHRLPKRLTRLTVGLSRGWIEEDFVFPYLETLHFSHCGDSALPFIIAHSHLRKLHISDGIRDITVEIIRALPRSITDLSISSIPRFTIELAQALPPFLLSFDTSSPDIVGEALEHLPLTLTSCTISTHGAHLVSDVSKWPPSLTKMETKVNMSDKAILRLPKTLKALPSNMEDYFLQSSHMEYFKHLPPFLEELNATNVSPQALFLLQCISTLRRLEITVPLNEAFILAISRFSALKELVIPSTNFDKHCKSIRMLRIETLELGYNARSIMEKMTLVTSETDPWVDCLPRTLLMLKADCLLMDPCELLDLPPKLTTLNVYVRPGLEMEDFASLPKSITSICITSSNFAKLRTSISNFASVLSVTLVELNMSRFTLELLEPPQDDYAALLKPLVLRCPGLSSFSISGSHPGVIRPDWPIASRFLDIVNSLKVSDADLLL